MPARCFAQYAATSSGSSSHGSLVSGSPFAASVAALSEDGADVDPETSGRLLELASADQAAFRGAGSAAGSAASVSYVSSWLDKGLAGSVSDSKRCAQCPLPCARNAKCEVQVQCGEAAPCPEARLTCCLGVCV